jgi:hypothetical protein
MSALSPLGEILQKDLPDMTQLEYCIYFAYSGTTAANADKAAAELAALTARIAELEAALTDCVLVMQEYFPYDNMEECACCHGWWQYDTENEKVIYSEHRDNCQYVLAIKTAVALLGGAK